MQLYPGIDPITTGSASGPGVVKFPFPTGFGSYTVAADCIAGADLRSATNLDAAPQGNRDAIAWLTWRTPDWISGGDYTSYVGAMTFGGAFFFKGQVSVSDNIEILSGGELEGALGSSGVWFGAFEFKASSAVKFDGTVEVTGTSAWTFDSSSTITFAGGSLPVFNTAVDFNGECVYAASQFLNGAGALVTLRISAGPIPSVGSPPTSTITVTDKDTWIIPALTADSTWVLAVPTGGTQSTRFRVRQQGIAFSQAHTLTVKLSTGTTVAVIAKGNVSERSSSLDFEWDPDSLWQVVGKYDPDSHVSVA